MDLLTALHVPHRRSNRLVYCCLGGLDRVRASDRFRPVVLSLIVWRMNILVLSNLFPPYSIGGYEVACEEVVRSFTTHSITVLTTHYGLPAPSVTGDVVRVFPNVFGLWPAGPLLTPRGWRRFFTPSVFELSNRWMARIRPDVCYVWNLQGLSLAPVAAARARRIPIVYHFEDTWLPDTIFHPQRQVEQLKHVLGSLLARRGTTGAIFVSDYLRRTYSSRGLCFGQSTVIHNGVRIQPDRRDYAAHAKLRLLFVGRVVPDKGLDLLMESLALANQRTPGRLALTVAGTGEDHYLVPLQHQAKQHQLDVTWLGRVHRDELPYLYASHDVVVVPSTWNEPFGLVAVEAMAAGTPVVATQSGGLPEIVRSGLNGWLVPPRDARALADALHQFIDEPDLAKTLGVRASEVVRQQFNITETSTAARRFVEHVVEV
jgi:glycogen synthase